MKVLVIPDVHLKPVIFQQATILMRRGIAERAVCLMDIPDDWGKEYQVELYEKTYDEAISFAKKFPETAWCYGNHDLSYFWHQLESGYSSMAAFTVQRKLLELCATVPENNPIRYVYKIDNVLFSHGGVLKYFVEEHVQKEKYDDADMVVEDLNKLGVREMWNDASPIWLRPQYEYYDYNVISIKSMMRTAYNYALKCIYREAEKTGNPVESYDTTLTMVIYDGHRIIYGHSGDGAILGLTQYGNYVEITSPQKGADLVSVLPLRAGYTQWVIDSYEEDLVAVLLVTDGMLETICPYLLKFGERSIYVPLAMFFSDPYCVDSDEAIDNIHQFLLAEDEYENDKFYNSIGMALYKHILDQARANEIYERIKNTNYPVVLMKSEQDDKTVVGLINADAELENQVVSYYDEPDWHKLQDMWNRRAYPHLYPEEKLSESDNADDLSEKL